MILGSPSHRNWQTKSEDEKSQQRVALQLFDGVLDRFPSPTLQLGSRTPDGAPRTRPPWPTSVTAAAVLTLGFPDSSVFRLF
jgi:hypothetical protein